jgi:hypothetical protein
VNSDDKILKINFDKIKPFVPNIKKSEVVPSNIKITEIPIPFMNSVLQKP